MTKYPSAFPTTLFLVISLFGVAPFSPVFSRPNLSDKFIPSAAVKYCGSGGCLPDSVTAKFDLLVTDHGNNAVWGKSGKNSWQNLKTYNPDMIIVMYMMGPSEYNTASWGQIGQGWTWMKANHGATAGANRWTGSGIQYPYLANTAYPNERIMNLGHPDWQTYWYDAVYNGWWGGVDSLKYRGADGIFSDNTQPEVIWKGMWYDENNVGVAANKDEPADYYSGGAYNDAKWRSDIYAFFNRAVPGLAAKPQKTVIMPNFGYMGKDPVYWTELDTLTHGPIAAMEEGGFACPWSKGYSVWNWDNLVNTMKGLKNVPVVMAQVGGISSTTGMAAMDVALDSGNLGRGTTGWDALWFSLASYLLALNKDKSNGFFSFTPTGYCEYLWLDEYDPKFFHLGAPLADYFVQNGVAFREYEDGWAVVNKTYLQNKTAIPVPSGRARVITHANFKNADSAPLVTSFNLNYYRGVILLKEGRKIGDQDNLVTTVSKGVKSALPSPARPLLQIAGASIRYVLGTNTPVLLRILDTRGRVMKTLESGTRTAGEYTVTWDKKDSRGAGAAGGVYVCSLSAGAIAIRKVMVLVK